MFPTPAINPHLPHAKPGKPHIFRRDGRWFYLLTRRDGTVSASARANSFAAICESTRRAA